MNARQGAQWIEDNFFSPCPVLPWSSMSSLLHFYHAWHGMKISPEDSWQLALMRFALPLARQRMVVVAPDSFSIPVALRNEAARSSISVDLLPLSTFSEERITGMRNRLTVKALDPDGFYYSAETEQALGRADQHFDLLPAYMRRQLKGR
jgi:hypothetical protein